MRGVELKYKREEFGYTQEEFADIIGISKRTLINWEQSDEIPKSKMHTPNVIKGKEKGKEIMYLDAKKCISNVHFIDNL